MTLKQRMRDSIQYLNYLELDFYYLISQFLHLPILYIPVNLHHDDDQSP
jgi:hypothetical protein